MSAFIKSTLVIILANGIGWGVVISLAPVVGGEIPPVWEVVEKCS
jgi:hypothetical protein